MIQLIVFIAGMSIMAIEMTAFRFLAPYFGTTQLIITIIIGTIMLAIAIGNWLGGRYGDKYPNGKGLSVILMMASILTFIIMLVCKPILAYAAVALSEQDMVRFAMTLMLTVFLFSLPFVLLGMISPYAIRVIASGQETIGRRAGLIYVLGTLGSLIGTYLPTFLFIPLWGANSTLIFFASVIFVISLLGLLKAKQMKLAAVSTVLVTCGIFLNFKHFYEKEGVIDTKESLYNLIQVVQEGDKVKLYLNEGHGYHSVYKKDSVLVDGVWDYFLGLPAMLPEREEKIKILIIGMAAGTISNIYSHYLDGQVEIDGVEIDPEITAMAKKHFALDERFLKVFHEDGRTFLSRKQGPYDIIMIDAYKQPYVPWHLTTTEFFQSCKNSLKPNGLLGINVATLKEESLILDCLEQSLAKVFPELNTIEIKNHDIEFTNNIVVASDKAPRMQNLHARLKNVPKALCDRIESKIKKVTLNDEMLAFSDDWAPVEWYVDLSLFNFFK